MPYHRCCSYVVKCLKPPMEVFHGVAGSSYSFRCFFWGVMLVVWE